MSVTIYVNKNALLAVALCASKKDVRKCLQGVCIEFHHDKTLLIATCGATLLAHRSEPTPDPLPAPITCSVPNEMLKSLKASSKALCSVAITVGDSASKDDHSRPITIADGATMVTGHTVDERFPDWRRAVPRSADGIAAQYDPALIDRFRRAALLIHPGRTIASLFIAHNGQAPALVGLGSGEFIGVLMPLRTAKIDLLPPDWATWST